MVDKLEKVKAEIERCIDRCNDKMKSCPVNTQVEAVCLNKISAYKDVLSFIDSLQEEPVKDRFAFKAIPRLLDMIEPSERAKSYVTKLADAFDAEDYHTDAEIVRESLKMMNGENVAMATMDEESVSEDLEEAANEWDKKAWFSPISMVMDGDRPIGTKQHITSHADSFKAGAQWQKQQDQETIELAEDHAMLAGMNKMKEQMINKACDWLKNWSYGYLIEKYGETDIDRNELVKDFKKYMED